MKAEAVYRRVRKEILKDEATELQFVGKCILMGFCIMAEAIRNSEPEFIEDGKACRECGAVQKGE